MAETLDADTAAHIDASAWLPGISGQDGAGWLLIKGWAFVSRGSAEIALAIEATPSNFVLITPFFYPVYVDRNDVRGVYHKAPIACGFDLVIPMPQPIPQQVKSVLVFRRDQSIHTCVIGSIEDYGDIEALYRHHGLDGAGKLKLENLLRNEAERLAGAVYKTSKPISLYIDPSFACNLHCPHCVSEKLREQGFSMKNMPADRVAQILEEYGPYLIRATLALWGEPLLNKRFADMVRLLKAYGVFCETSTNLSVPLTDARIEEIIASGLDEMRLSIDGATQETYEKYRVGGDLGLVLRNVRRLVDIKRRLGVKKPKLRWQYLLFPWNHHEREAAERLAVAYGVDEFCCFPGDLWEQPPSIQARSGADDNIALGQHGRAISAGFKRHQANYEFVGCDFLEHTLAIHSDGTVFPCCYYPAPKDALGTWEDLQADAFNAPRLVQLRNFVQAFRNGEPQSGPSPCAACGALSRGYVADHLSFMRAFELLTAKP